MTEAGKVAAKIATQNVGVLIYYRPTAIKLQKLDVRIIASKYKIAIKLSCQYAEKESSLWL
jgi:hypothetical protein